MAMRYNPLTQQMEEDNMDASNPEASAVPNDSAQSMPPQVKDYLAQKYNLEPNLGEKIGALLATAGAGIGGRDANAAGMNILNTAKADKLKKSELDRQAVLQGREDEKYAQDQEKLKREKDPNSPESKMAQELAAKMGYQGDVSSITADKFKQFSPALEKMYTLTENSREKDLDRKLKEAQLNAANIEKATKRNELNASDSKFKTQLDTGLSAVKGMKNALNAGNNTFSLIGDNDFTRNARVAAEMFGRLQSGGAINKDEEKRFMAMLPGVTDSAEQQAKKLQQAEDYYNQAAKNFKGGKYSKQEEPEPLEKVINGKTYRKVKGGWEEVE